jgi:hypothetical protein
MVKIDPVLCDPDPIRVSENPDCLRGSTPLWRINENLPGWDKPDFLQPAAAQNPDEPTTVRRAGRTQKNAA